MNRILLSLASLALFFGCGQQASFKATEQTLEWPLLEEVSDIRAQICMLGGHYLIATDKSVYQLNDSNEDTKPILLFTFPDSLSKTITDIAYPGDTAYTLNEIGGDYFRGMPDFLIEKIHVLNKDHLMLYLTFNSITRSRIPGSKGYGANRDIRSWSLNIQTHELEPLPNKGFKNFIFMDTLRSVDFDSRYPIMPLQNASKSFLYSSNTRTQPNNGPWALDNLITQYNLENDSVLGFELSALAKAQSLGEIQITKNYQIIGIENNIPHLIISLDTSDFKNILPWAIRYYKPNNCFLSYSYMGNTQTGTYHCRLDIIDKEGKPKTIWEQDGINVPSPDIHGDAENGYHLIYDKEGEIIQVNVLAQ